MIAMPTKRAAWTERFIEILGDGRWHDQRDLIEACQGLVPPGVGYRSGERDRLRFVHRPNGPGARVRGDDATSIAVGAAKKIRASLYVQHHLGHIERRQIDGRTEFRLAR